MSLNIGDRVLFNAGGVKDFGEGTVAAHDGFHWGVRFDKPHDALHNLGEAGSPTNGWWVLPSDVTVLSSAGDISNPLFHYKASDGLATDAWGMLVNGVRGLDWDSAKAKCKEWEEEYKATGSTVMPAAWRSAKSVIKGALQNDVPLMDGEEVRGKTAVEKGIKAVKEADKEVNNPTETAMKLMKKAVDFARNNGHDPLKVLEAVL